MLLSFLGIFLVVPCKEPITPTSRAVGRLFSTNQVGGQGTFYSIPTSEAPSGSCNLPTAPPKGSRLHFYSSVAMNFPQFMNSAVCGACLEVYSTGAFIGFGSWPTPPSKMFVHVTNECGTCPTKGSLDFGFPQQGKGVWGITWRAVSCQISEPIQLFFLGSSQWYLQVQARSTNYPYQGINLLNENQWKSLVRTSYGFFTLPDHMKLPLQYPLKFQIVSITGEIVTASINEILNEHLFNADGQFEIAPNGASPPKVTEIPKSVSCQSCGNYWIQLVFNGFFGKISNVIFSYGAHSVNLKVSSWSSETYIANPPAEIGTDQVITITLHCSSGIFSTKTTLSALMQGEKIPLH